MSVCIMVNGEIAYLSGELCEAMVNKKQDDKENEDIPVYAQIK